MISEFSSHYHTTAFSNFLAYKTRVPVRGAILLNHDMDQVLLVKGWKKSANWSFPRGKINKDEADLDCAIREVYEETGFHVRDAGLIMHDENVKHIDITMREQQMRLYVFPGIPMNVQFAPRTRKEISKIQWYKLSDLPTLKRQKQQQGQTEDLIKTANKFYMVAPFMVPLKKWISQQKKIAKPRQHNKAPFPSVTTMLDGITADNQLPVDDFNTLLDINEEDTTFAYFRHEVLNEPMSDLPEVSARPVLSIDPAAELKSILKVPPRNASISPNPAIAKASTALKSSALLALLKAGTIKEIDKTPHTPAEQMIRSAQMPSSPKHHHQHPKNKRRLPQLATNLDPPMADRDTNVTVQNLESLTPAGNGSTEQVVTRKHGPHGNNSPIDSEISVPEPHVVSTNVPPYQITGDPQFAQNPHIPSIDASSLPQASEIPPPKLTLQSSSLWRLLDNQQSPAATVSLLSPKGLASSSGLEPIAADSNHPIPSRFKQGDNGSQKNLGVSTEVPLISKSAEQISLNLTPMNGPDSSPNERSRQEVRRRDPTPIPIPYNAEKPLKSDVPLSETKVVGTCTFAITTSEHQKSLLNLFRKPSLSNTEGSSKKPSKMLEPPSKLAELSASPSPGHSREPSQLKTPIASHGSSLPRIMNNLARLKKQRSSDLKPSSAPVFATVNGPLKVPIFEVLSGASKEPRSAASLVNNLTRLEDRSPTIVASPSANNQRLPGQLEQASLQTVTGGLNSGTQAHDSSKRFNSNPFDTHISRPPAEEAKFVQKPSTAREMQAVPSFSIDRLQGNASHDHKKILLSFLNKSTLPTESNIPFKFSPTRGPSPERSRFDPVSSRVVSSLTDRSRIGGVTPGSGERDIPAGGESPLPGTTPGHKDFLLGYLDGVAKTERGLELY